MINSNFEPFLVGLAGESCSGKNIAASFLKEQGFFCIDADKISRQIFKENQAEILKLFEPIAKKRNVELSKNFETKPSEKVEFGCEPCIDRKEFAMLVFSDFNLLKKHENFILPKIEKQIQIEIDRAFFKNPSQVIVLNAPTLHKTKFVKICKFILYIKSPLILRIFRAKRRDKLPLKNILARFSKQKNFFSQYLCLSADTVIVKNCVSLFKFKQRILAEFKKRVL